MTQEIMTRSALQISDGLDPSLWGKLERRTARYVHRDLLAVKIDRPIVSFSFDDCPKSVIENALPLLEAEGWLSTIYLASGLCDTTNYLGLHMSLADAQACSVSGHEIGDHTFSHWDAAKVSAEAFLADIEHNSETLDAANIPAPTTFAYPYGGITLAVKKALANRFDLKRGVVQKSSPMIDLNLSPSQRLYSGDDMDDVLSAVDQLGRNPAWLVLFSHDVRDNPSPYGCTAKDLARTIRAVKEINAIVLPVAGALAHLRGRSS